MAEASSVNDVFRFIQLRPQRAARQVGVVVLARDTAMVKALTTERTTASRMRIATEAVGASRINRVGDVRLGETITAAIAKLRATADPTVADLRRAVRGLDRFQNGRDFDQQRDALSDVLLASHFATEGFPADLAELQDVYRVYHLGEDDAGPMSGFLARPLLAPSLPPADRPIRSGGGLERPVTNGTAPSDSSADRNADEDSDDEAVRLAASIEELMALDRPSALVQPDSDGTAPKGAIPFTLTSSAQKQLSSRTEAVLQERGIRLSATPLDVAVTALTEEYLTVRPIRWATKRIVARPGVTLPPPPAHALVRPAGVADLLVVKQQIKRYEPGEIAHIENVLIGEKKSRAHRRLERSEESVLTETETTRTQETELETADRFELNRETSRTVKADQKTGFGLSLSGKYGPAVDFTSKVEQSIATAEEESAKNSSRYARDVVSRSLERVTERVREVRTRTIIRETEETNLHELANDTTEHVRGVYQFVDKVYETQVFNYGIRQMFDFMIPEPASFLWYIEANPALDVELPPEPPKLDLVAPDASHIDEANALALAAVYGATDVEHAPAPYQLLTANVKHGDDDADETGQPHGAQRAELQVPGGYRPLRARIRGLAFTDENPIIAVAVGSRTVVWKPSSSRRTPLSAGNELVHEPELAVSLNTDPYELAADAKLGVSVLAWETNTYSLEIIVVVQRTPRS